MSCKLREDDTDLLELVSTLQRHSHSSFCRKSRYHYSKVPTPHTVIGQRTPPEDDANGEAQTDHTLYKGVVERFQSEVMEDSSRSLQQVLDAVDVHLEVHIQAIIASTLQGTVHLQHEPQEHHINKYKSSLLQPWLENMDIQYVMDAWACAIYI